jgi:hypothetical protein
MSSLISSSSFVSDSVFLADQLGVKHFHLMRDLNRIQKSANPNFGLATYRDEQGKPRPKYLLSVRNLITLAVRLPKLRNRVEVFTEALIEQVQQAKAAELRAVQAQLSQAQKQLSACPDYVVTKRGTKVLSDVPADEKKVFWFDPETQEPCKVLADSLTFEELFEATCGMEQARVRADGIIQAVQNKEGWRDGALQAKAEGRPIPSMRSFGVSSEYEANFRRALIKQQ